jgi:hypothetical protein
LFFNSPDFFPDIVTMLRGMNCEKFIENFAEHNVNLFEFLTITDERLKEIGIAFNFQRNMILVGLHNYHLEAWSKESLFIPESRKLSEMDVMMTFVNVLRQMTCVEAQIVYLKRLGRKLEAREAATKLLKEIRGNVEKLKKMTNRKKIENPLIIKPKEKSGKITGKVLAVTAILVLALAIFKVAKK